MDDTLKLELTCEIVSSYVSNNPVPRQDLPSILQQVAASLEGLDGEAADQEDTKEYTAFTSVRKSIQPEHLVCLECGAKFKTLKRHIRASHGLTIEGYKDRYKLASDYPMIAPAYSEKRTAIALDIGLGRK